MKHNIDTAGISKSGWPEYKLTIQIESLSKSELSKSARHLINHVDLLVEENLNDDSKMYPIEIELSSDIRLSEALFWPLLIENCENSLDLIVAYIDKLNELYTQHDLPYILFNSEEYPAGSHALFSYIDFLHTNQIRSRETLTKIQKSYLIYMNFCDLDLEVHQERYTSKLLTLLRTVDQEKYLELLYFRLFNGQQGLWDKEYAYLRGYIGEVHLKAIVDLMINKHNESSQLEGANLHDARQFYNILISVYGSSDKQINEVLSYVRQKVAVPIGDVNHKLSILERNIQATCDLSRQLTPNKDGLVDSGFHTYDMQTKEWLSYKHCVKES